MKTLSPDFTITSETTSSNGKPEIRIQTAVGPLYLVIHSADSLFIGTESGYTRAAQNEYLCLNNVAYTVSARFCRTEAGTWERQGWHFILRRRDSRPGTYDTNPSPAAEDKARALLTQIVNALTANRAALLDTAEQAQTRTNIARLDSKIAALRAEIESLDAERAALQATCKESDHARLLSHD